MIFTNKTRKSSDIEAAWGILHALKMGEHGRGRREVVIPIPASIDELAKGSHEDLTVALSKTGRPKIISGSDGIYLLLDTYGGYTRRGNGFVQCLKGHKDDFTVLASGNGADGDAGRIGQWDVLCIQCNVPDGILRLHYSGGDGSTIIKISKSVQELEKREFLDLCDYMDVECPFSLDKEGNFSREEWEDL